MQKPDACERQIGMTLFPPQQEVIDSGILENRKHCLLHMATGSGKTFLSEFAIEKTLSSGYKVIYVTPLRALATQQQKNWKGRFPGHLISVFTGDTVQRDKRAASFSCAQLLIMTPERLDACLRNWRTHWNWIPSVGLIVFDEFHLLGQAERGPRLEGSITRFIRLNPFVKYIGLSATMPNVEDLSTWLRGQPYSSKWRQVPLEKRFVRFTSAKNKPGLLLHEVKRCVDSGGQSLVFCNSRSRVQEIAEILTRGGFQTAYHHAGLAQEKRTEVESAFRAKSIQVLVATSTLEMGLNLPARQVVIYDAYTFFEGQFSPLPVWSYIQRAGRAGRPGLDESGEVVLFLAKWAEGKYKYEFEECEPVCSFLTSKKAMAEQILIDVYAGYSRTREELVNGFLPLTLYKHEHPEAQINGVVNNLLLTDLLQEKTEEDTRSLKVTLLGRLAIKLMFTPETVKLVYDAYKRFDSLYLFDLLLLAALSEDCSPVLRANQEELDMICELVTPMQSSLMELTVENLGKLFSAPIPTLRILAAVKMAALCRALTQGQTSSELAQKFRMYETDIVMLQDSIVRLLFGIAAIISAVDKSGQGEDTEKASFTVAKLSGMLADMVRYRLDSTLIPLTYLSGVGGKTAKRLADAGFLSLKEIAAADQAKLCQVEKIGEKRALSMIKEAVRLVAEGKDVIYQETAVGEIKSVRAISTSCDPYRLRRSLELVVRAFDGGRFCVTGGREDHIVLKHISGEFTCDCMDYAKHKGDCKHILCVKRMQSDPEICRMVNRIKESKSRSIREALPSLWYAVAEPRRE